MSNNPESTRRSNQAPPIRVVADITERIAQSVGQVIIGKRNEVRLAVLGLLCRGHILIEDIPGVGKTMMARSLSKAIGCSFSRIQFTPDMLPSDVTGVSIYNQRSNEFEFRAGPIPKVKDPVTAHDRAPIDAVRWHTTLARIRFTRPGALGRVLIELP